MSSVAIIPARGGSKRIPGKNIRPFMGKPIIGYSIEAAKATGLFQRIIVSTDSDEIAQISKKFGAEIPFIRPLEIASDSVHSDVPVLHALEWLRDHDCKVEFICCIYATAPLILPEYICKGFQLLVNEGANSAFSVTSFSYPIFRGLKIKRDGRLEMILPQYLAAHSQDLPKAYYDAAQFYWARADAFLKEKTFLSSDAYPVVIPRAMVQDIDTLEDWEMAEILYRAYVEKQKNKWCLNENLEN